MTAMHRKLANCEAAWFILADNGSIEPAPELPPPPIVLEEL